MHLSSRPAQGKFATMFAIAAWLIFSGPLSAIAGPAPLTPDGPLTSVERGAFILGGAARS